MAILQATPLRLADYVFNTSFSKPGINGLAYIDSLFQGNDTAVSDSGLRRNDTAVSDSGLRRNDTAVSDSGLRRNDTAVSDSVFAGMTLRCQF